jgi:hypothetical protein
MAASASFATVKLYLHRNRTNNIDLFSLPLLNRHEFNKYLTSEL